jgi:hypothetical protein
VAITLVAAVLHAVRNAVAHAIPDRPVGFALIGVAYVVGGGIGALAYGLPPSAAWPSVVGSASLHVVHNLLLRASYQLGEFSQVYPVARGTAPWVVAVIEVALGHAPGGPMRFTALVPVSVTLATPARLSGEAGPDSAAELGWRRCAPAWWGCWRWPPARPWRRPG